jgi:hypothetical protein
MRRALIAAALPLLFVPLPAHGQEGIEEDDEEDIRAPYIADLELGARIGLQGGGGVTPGGFRIAGAYLQRMTSETWFDGEASFVFGGGGRSCYYNRNVDFVCAPGLVEGFAAQFSAGGRWYPTITESGFIPFLRGGAALHIPHFGDDEVTGLALPLWLGAGGRYRVTPRIAITADLTITFGGALYNRDMGIAPYTSLHVQFGVDIAP